MCAAARISPRRPPAKSSRAHCLRPAAGGTGWRWTIVPVDRHSKDGGMSAPSINFEVNGKPVAVDAPPLTRLSGCPARSAEADRRQSRLRRRRLRRLHGADRRRTGMRLPRAGRLRWRVGRCGPSKGWRTASCRPCRIRSCAMARRNAAPVRPACWSARPRCWRRKPRPDGRRGSGRARRRALPLHGIPQDHRGGDGCWDMGDPRRASNAPSTAFGGPPPP